MKQCNLIIRLILVLAFGTALFNVHTCLDGRQADVRTGVRTWEVNDAQAAIEVRDVGESVKQETMPEKIDVSTFVSEETDVSFKFSYLATFLTLLVAVGGSVCLIKFKGGKVLRRGISAGLIILFSSFMFLAPYTNIIPDTPEAYAAVPALRATGSLATSNGLALTVTLPTHETDDILLLFAEVAGSDTIDSDPTDWTAVTGSPWASGSTNGDTRGYIWWKRAASSSETNPEIPAPVGAANHTVARAISVQGAITTGSPIDFVQAGEASNDGTLTLTGSTTNVSEVLVLLCGFSTNNANSTTVFESWTSGDLANVTEIFDETSTIAGGGGHGCATGEKAVSGAFGDGSVTITAVAGTVASSVTFGLKPPAAGGELSDDASVKIRGGTTIRGGVKFR